MAASQLRFSPLSNAFKNRSTSSILSTRINPISLRVTRSSSSSSTHRLTTDSGNSGFRGGSGGGGSGDNNNGWSSSDGDARGGGGSRNVVDAFFSGWRSRVAADPEFPFKVLMEEVVGISATAVGDMASRPNFGLSELDLVLSTLVVCSIVNFALMYLLAPTSSTTSATAAAAAASSALPSYIFQPGNFSLLARTATFFYKGLLFSAVGFVSGLVGTTLSNTLVAIKNSSKDEEEGVKKKKKKKGGPPTVLNAATWAVNMGLSSNLRYQTLNGVEFVMVRSMPPGLFKVAVLLLRALNNVLGGMSFVALGKIMGSQKVSSDSD